MYSDLPRFRTAASLVSLQTKKTTLTILTPKFSTPNTKFGIFVSLAQLLSPEATT